MPLFEGRLTLFEGQPVRYAKDAAGHEHDEKGLFTGNGGGAGKKEGPAKKPGLLASWFGGGKAKPVAASEKPAVTAPEKPAAKPGPKAEPKPEAQVAEPDEPPEESSYKNNAKLPRQSRPKLTEDEEVGAYWYTDDNFEHFNPALRSGDKLDREQQKNDDRLQSAFAKTKPFAKPVAAKRGLNVPSKDIDGFIDKLKTASADGSDVSMGGYISTTTSDEIAAKFTGNVSLTINATRGLDMRPFSANQKEDELLLDRNAKFRIKAVRQAAGPGGNDVWHIELDQLPGGA